MARKLPKQKPWEKKEQKEGGKKEKKGRTGETPGPEAWNLQRKEGKRVAKTPLIKSENAEGIFTMKYRSVEG